MGKEGAEKESSAKRKRYFEIVAKKKVFLILRGNPCVCGGGGNDGDFSFSFASAGSEKMEETPEVFAHYRKEERNILERS